MNNLLYIIAAVFIVMWAIGFIGFHDTWGKGLIIHYLLLAALMAVFVRRYPVKKS